MQGNTFMPLIWFAMSFLSSNKLRKDVSYTVTYKSIDIDVNSRIENSVFIVLLQCVERVPIGGHQRVKSKTTRLVFPPCPPSLPRKARDGHIAVCREVLWSMGGGGEHYFWDGPLGARRITPVSCHLIGLFFYRSDPSDAIEQTHSQHNNNKSSDKQLKNKINTLQAQKV